MGQTASINYDNRIKSFSSLDKKIHMEYQIIKGKLSKQEIKENFPEYEKYSEKVFLNLKFSKKVKRFMKWHKMSFRDSERKFLKNEKFSKVITDSSTNSMSIEKYSLSPIISPLKRYTNLEPNSKKSLSSYNSSRKSDSDLSCYSKSLPSNLETSNTVEEGLRTFYELNKNRFTNRVIKGPPDSFRWAAWLILNGVPLKRNEEMYFHLLNMDLDLETEIQITKDITRTLKDQNIDALELENKLYRLLKAFALIDRDLSYCQGMNFIFGFFLIVSDFNELDTLYLLIAIFSNTFNDKEGLRNLYTPGFPLLSFYLFLFDHYFILKLPSLHKHFAKLDLQSHCWIGKWFQTIYSHCLCYESLLRLWDCIFAYGLEFIISFSLSLLKYLQKDLLELNDLAEVTEFFKRLNTTHFKQNCTDQIEYNIEEILKSAKNKFKITKEEIEAKKNEFYKQNENNIDVPYIINNLTYNLDEFVNTSKIDLLSYYTGNSNPEKAKLKVSTTEETFEIIKEKPSCNENDLEEDSEIENIEEDVFIADLNQIENNIKILEMNDKNCIKFVNLFIEK